MNRQEKIDFLNRLRDGRAATEELDPVIIVVKDKIGSTCRNARTGRIYRESDLQFMRDKKVVIIIIGEDELDL